MEGHIHASLFGEPGGVYVYGYGEHITIKEWYELIIRVGREEGYWRDRELRINHAGRGRLGTSEVEDLRVDFGKLATLTGWAPRHSWTEGLRQTIRWYADNRERWIGRADWF